MLACNKPQLTAHVTHTTVVSSGKWFIIIKASEPKKGVGYRQTPCDKQATDLQ